MIFRGTCAFSRACLAHGMDKLALAELHALVEHIGPLHAGERGIITAYPFEGIGAVRAGTVKTAVLDRNGNEHVLGFHLPSEVIGLDGIDGDRYPCNAVALDTVTPCRFSFPQMALLAARVPGLQQELFRLMSRNISNAAVFAGDFSADERMAAFLLGLSRRYAARGYSPTHFQLNMPRTDMANYLHLPPPPKPSAACGSVSRPTACWKCNAATCGCCGDYG